MIYIAKSLIDIAKIVGLLSIRIDTLENQNEEQKIRIDTLENQNEEQKKINTNLSDEIDRIKKSFAPIIARSRMEYFIYYYYSQENDSEKKKWPKKGKDDSKQYLSISGSFGYMFSHKISSNNKIKFFNKKFKAIGNDIVNDLLNNNNNMTIEEVSEILKSFRNAYSNLSDLSHPPDFVSNEIINYNQIKFKDPNEMTALKTLVKFADNLPKI
jgi:hypothetical protein